MSLTGHQVDFEFEDEDWISSWISYIELSSYQASKAWKSVSNDPFRNSFSVKEWLESSEDVFLFAGPNWDNGDELCEGTNKNEVVDFLEFIILIINSHRSKWVYHHYHVGFDIPEIDGIKIESRGFKF